MPAAARTMDLFVGTLLLRPYVFAFLAAFLVAGVRDLGWRRTLLLGACAWPVALGAEFSSTRTGIPFGLYHYTGDTRGQELFIADVPFMDSLSFTFLAYASFCLARTMVEERAVSRTALAVLSGALMMALDIVIDPVAVLGDRWFLGRIFYYAEPGLYFGVPVSNFLGWWLVGTVGIGGYLAAAGAPRGREPRGGVALYYSVVVFNLAVTLWIGEWWLAVLGATLHGVLGMGLWRVRRTAEPRVDFGERGVQNA